MSALIQCPRCTWWTYRLEPGGACLDCTVGWTACPEHGRLEHAGSDHRRVGAYEVIATIRTYRQKVATIPVPPTGPRGVSGQR